MQCGDPIEFMPQKWTSLNNSRSRVHFFCRERDASENKVHGSQAENGKGNKSCKVVKKGGPQYGNLNLIETQGPRSSDLIKDNMPRCRRKYCLGSENRRKELLGQCSTIP